MNLLLFYTPFKGQYTVHYTLQYKVQYTMQYTLQYTGQYTVQHSLQYTIVSKLNKVSLLQNDSMREGEICTEKEREREKPPSVNSGAIFLLQ